MKPLKVLIVEDSKDDAALLLRHISNEGYEIQSGIVQTAADMKAALDERDWDIVLSDYTMPHFSGLDALRILRESEQRIPIIIISGTIGEDIAVDAMLKGANDYLMKDNLARLIPAIERDLKNAARSRAQKQAEEKLIQLSSIVELSNDAIITTDLNSVIVSCNRSAELLYGYGAAEVIGKNLLLLFPPGREDEESRIMESISNGGSVEHFETVRIKRDGSLCDLSLTVSPVKNANGEIVGASQIARDFTERKRIERALEEAAKRERAMIENALDVICTIDAAGNFISINPACFRMWGYHPEELIGRPFLDFVAPEDVKRTAQMDANIVGGTKTTNFENRYVHKNGTLVDVRWTSYYSESEQLVFNVAHDITEHKKVEGALKASEIMQRQLAARQSSILDALPAHICLIDETGNILEVNDEWKQFAIANGYKGFNFGVGSSYLEACNNATEDCSEIAKKAADICRSVLSGEAAHCEMEYPCHSPTEKRWFKQTVTSLDNEKQTGAVIMHVNITERKRIEEELKQTRDAALESARLKSEFLANMSHEIRTPMNGVIGMTGLLIETDLSATQQEYTKTIETSANALLTVIDDILDFSKIEAGQLRFEKLDFDIRGTVRSTIEILAERAQSKGLQIASLINEEVPTLVRGDPGRLRQILTNLIGNAVKFTHRGKVTVNVRMINDSGKYVTLRFEVIDTGIGIQGESQKRLFQAFVQADGSTTRKYGGSGLGLTISKHLVELMDGQIGLESEPGTGSTFWFTARFEKQATPISAAQTVKDFTVLQNNVSDTLQKTRILVAEDNAVNRLVIVAQLKSLGYSPTVVTNGREAVQALQKSEYDVVLMDCQMPEMDGFEATAEIRASEDDAHHQIIIAITANALDADRKKCLAAGMDDYLSKPAKIESLRQKLEQWTICATKETDHLPEPPQNLTENEPPLIVDLSVLESYKDYQKPGEPDLVSKLILLFARDTALRLLTLKQSGAKGDTASIKREAHNAKGAASNIGAFRMAEICRQLEQKASIPAEANDLISRLESEFNQAVEILGSVK